MKLCYLCDAQNAEEIISDRFSRLSIGTCDRCRNIGIVAETADPPPPDVE